MTDPDLREPEPISFRPQAPSQVWQPWTLVIPALLLLPLLSLAFAWQISPSDDADLRRPIRHYARNAEAFEAHDNKEEPESVPTPQPAPTANLPVPSSPLSGLQKITYFVPNEQGQLHSKTTSTIGGQGRADFAALGKAAVNALFPEAPGYAPPGAQAENIQFDSAASVARVSLNEAFWQSNFWTGETRADTAMQAIAHTLQAAYRETGGKGQLQVQLLRDEQPMEVLGEFDVSEPYRPEADAVASP